MESAQSIPEESSRTLPQRRKVGKARPFSAFLDKSLFIIITTMLIFTVVLLSLNLVFQHQNYSAGISAAMKYPSNIDHAAILSYSRAWDFSIIKVSSIFLGFCLILIGALYVLRVAIVSYSLSVEAQNTKGALETGSPGLVMLTLGVILVVIIALSNSKVDYYSPNNQAGREASQIPPDKATPAQEEKLQLQIPEKQKGKQ